MNANQSSSPIMHRLLVGMFGLLVMISIIPVAVIAFNAPTSPPAMASMATPARRSTADFPAPRQFEARDGGGLQYYAYPAEPGKVAVLVHGTASPGTSMHVLAESLRAAGTTAYVLDIRGHGGSGRRGDIDYIGQIDDDLADFVTELGPKRSGETRTLVGFSGGAGFAIRFAGGPYGALFDRYVFLAPILPGSPTLRQNSGGWINVSLPRAATITWLGRLGIHWFDGFSVISYAVTPEMLQPVTASYSYRLMMNFGAGSRYETYLRNIHRPAAVLVGAADEQEFADRFAPLLQRLDVNIPVLVPNMKHADMIAAPAALQVVVGAIAPQK